MIENSSLDQTAAKGELDWGTVKSPHQRQLLIYRIFLIHQVCHMYAFDLFLLLLLETGFLCAAMAVLELTL